jgi:hypothetical protein
MNDDELKKILSHIKKVWLYILCGFAGVIVSTTFLDKSPRNKKQINQQSTTNYVVYPIANHNKRDDTV